MNPSPTTGVWWDLNTCPVPADHDPGRVRTIIESALKKHFGPSLVTVFAVGNLEHISPVLLKEISSSGILLRHTVFRGLSIRDLLSDWETSHPPPAKIMLISGDSAWFNDFSSFGYTILRAFPDPRPPFYKFPPAKEWFWESLLQENSGHAEISNHILNDEPAGFCMLCEIPSQGCDDFINHLRSTEHKEELFDVVPSDEYDKPVLFCKLCEYPGYDRHNMEIHYKSEEHTQKRERG